MDKHLALLTLGLSADAEDEDIQEALELKIFEIKNYLLSQPVVLKLYRARQTKLKQLAEIQQQWMRDEQPIEQTLSTLSTDDLLSLLMSYERALANIRLMAAGTLSAARLAFFAEQLMAVQHGFESHFLRLTEHIEPSRAVSASHAFPSGKIILHLKQGQLQAVVDLLQTEKARILALNGSHR